MLSKTFILQVFSLSNIQPKSDSNQIESLFKWFYNFKNKAKTYFLCKCFFINLHKL